MADTKISALTGATTPLAGTEVLPIVQGSTTKKVSVADLTAGRAVTAASMVATGVVSGTAIYSYAGVVAYPVGSVPTTIFTMPSDGMYVVFFYLNGAGDQQYLASTQAYKSGASTRLANTQNGTYLSITLSGSNIQASHPIAGFPITYAIQRLAQ